MASDQASGATSSVPAAHEDGFEGYQLPLSPVSSEDATQSSTFEEGNSGDDSGFHTASDPDSSGLEMLDRDSATGEIIGILSRYDQISFDLLEWANIFLNENPEMLTRSSTIVTAYPDREKVYAEFHRGLSAICRIISDDRLNAVRDWAVRLEGEWADAPGTGHEAPAYSDFIDLVYSEAERVAEQGEGAYRVAGDVEIVGEVFGFAKKDHEGGEETKGKGEGDREGGKKKEIATDGGGMEIEIMETIE